MSVELFVDVDAQVEVPVGTMTIVMRKYADAGIQEDIESENTKWKVEETEDLEGEASFNRVGYTNPGNLKYIQRMVIGIRMPDGTYSRGPLTMAKVRAMSREAMLILLDTIEEHNPPLSEIRDRLDSEKMNREQEGVRELVAAQNKALPED